jgi:hypothetical protein
MGFEGLGFTAYEDYSAVPLPITSGQMQFSTAVAGPPYTGGTVYAFPAHLQLPYTLQWNASIQQALGKSQVFSLTYVGSNGRRLTGQHSYSLTSLNPNFGSVVEFPADLTSNYQALQLQFQRRVVADGFRIYKLCAEESVHCPFEDAPRAQCSIEIAFGVDCADIDESTVLIARLTLPVRNND